MRRGPAQGEQEHRRDPGLGGADAAGDPRPVVVAQHPVGPGAGGQAGLVGPHDAGDAPGVPRRLDELEVEGHLHARQPFAVVGDQPGQRQVDLADQHAVLIFVRHLP